MITNFRLFEKTKTFIVNGKGVSFDLHYNKIGDEELVRKLDLSYQELVDTGIWNHIGIRRRKFVIGPSYSFHYFTRNVVSNTNLNDVEYFKGQVVICFDDKPGPYGGKPTVTEGKEYVIHDVQLENIKIKNDNNRLITLSIDRFCKTQFGVDVSKYNL